jgi:hypothetical protein
MADDDQLPQDGQQDAHSNGQTDAQLVTQLLQQFTEAIRDLADGRQPSPSPDDEARRARLQRIDFGYRALGALMGRVSRTTDKEFDVPTFAASWDDDRPVIHLVGLLEAVTWVELRAPATPDCPAVEETVKVIRYGRGEPDAAGRKSRSARLEPREIGPDRTIESMVGLGGLTGPLLAFGPRLAPRTTEYVNAE